METAVERLKRGVVWILVVAGLLGFGLGCSVAGTRGGGPGDAVGGIGTDAGAAADDATLMDGTPPASELDEERSEAPALEVNERLSLAYGERTSPKVAPLGDSRAVRDTVVEWPEMLYMGEEGQIGRVGIRPVEIRIVRGGNVPMAYSPEGDEMVAAPEGSPGWMRGTRNRPVLVIPPNASLVMVRIETTPSVGYWTGPGECVCAAGGTGDYKYMPERFWVSYPGLGETPVHLSWGEWWFGEYQPVGTSCPGSGWLYFTVAELDPDPALLWLEYVVSGMPGQLGFWTLASRP